MKERLLREHRNIEALASALDAALRVAKPDVERLSGLRWELAKAMMQHIAFEDRHVYLPLERHADPAVSSVALAVKASIGEAQADYEAHTALWTATAMAASWKGYVAASLRQLAILHRCIRREEQELFPLIPRLAAAPGPVPAAQRNWARTAWNVHAALDRR